jgi:hypothetical protein
MGKMGKIFLVGKRIDKEVSFGVLCGGLKGFAGGSPLNIKDGRKNGIKKAAGLFCSATAVYAKSVGAYEFFVLLWKTHRLRSVTINWTIPY